MMLRSRKRFDKLTLLYDQAREKFLSLRKGTKLDTTLIIEEDLGNSRSTLSKLASIWLLLFLMLRPKKMEPYVNQVLTYAQQSRERSNYEQAALTERMQEYRRQIDLEFAGLQKDNMFLLMGTAESAMDQMDWIEKITGVIASLLTSQTSEQRLPGSLLGTEVHYSASESGPFESHYNSDHRSSKNAHLKETQPLVLGTLIKKFKEEATANAKTNICLAKVCGNTNTLIVVS
ncbi:hypothetical protein GIB67_038954 [Kingdonia uniflora]|uniref:Uncharacterized protein n=1 Tax=Kingdonia uniflora TaxID=39325 RepID=A0A7J7P8T7_9MAGN|nr:hypothetical protein GIB67_038954 [Kingdonia uniflora]